MRIIGSLFNENLQFLPYYRSLEKIVNENVLTNNDFIGIICMYS